MQFKIVSGDFNNSLKSSPNGVFICNRFFAGMIGLLFKWKNTSGHKWKNIPGTRMEKAFPGQEWKTFPIQRLKKHFRDKN